MPNVKSRYVIMVSSALTLENVLDAILIAEELALPELKQQCFEFFHLVYWEEGNRPKSIRPLFHL